MSRRHRGDEKDNGGISSMELNPDLVNAGATLIAAAATLIAAWIMRNRGPEK